jgi:rhodanese-related sulfurtransferase
VDVRVANIPSFRDFHVPGSLYIPIWKLEWNLKRLDPKAETILVCHQGDGIAPDAQEILWRRGFSEVRILKGGLFSYIENEGLSVLESRFA